ncbi:MAG: hypothetical protein OEM81_04140 [Acidimicrobiia bacterium]|nr:hypothetical protein [Acidimicrobiia bacterium]MDH3397005.1 hypothetical protein [Acidimicrobiia bacterium]
MPEILEQTQTTRVPKAPPARSRAIEFTLAILGFLCLAAGAYLLFAAEDWWLGDLVESWHLGAFIIGGVLMMTGLGVYANESYHEDGQWTARVTTGAVVAVLALAGAVTAALFLIF